MISVLTIILFILLTIIGGKRGIKTFITLFTNLILIFILMLLISWGLNPVICTLIISIIIIIVTLFFLNKTNIKTISSCISILLILLLMLLIINIFNSNSHIQGYAEETIEKVSYVEYNTGLNMLDISKSIIIIGLIGSIIDTSIAISSALYEVHINNPKLSIKQLYKSGLNIGKDILGTTLNTLFFAFIGSYISVFIYFADFSYNISTIINSKLFLSEYVRICLSGIGCFLIIPLTSIILSMMCYKGDIYEKIKDCIRRQRITSNK